MSKNNPNDVSRNLDNMTAEQLKKLAEETAQASPQEEQTPGESVQPTEQGMSTEAPNEASKELPGMTDGQLNKLAEEAEVREKDAEARERQIRKAHIKGLLRFASTRLFRIVKDVKLDLKQAKMILRVAKKKRVRNDFKAQQVIDELELRVIPELKRLLRKRSSRT